MSLFKRGHSFLSEGCRLKAQDPKACEARNRTIKALIFVVALFGTILSTSSVDANSCSHDCAEAIGCYGGCEISSSCGVICYGGGCSYTCKEMGTAECNFENSGSCDQAPPPRSTNPLASTAAASTGYQWAFIEYEPQALLAGTANVQTLGASSATFAQSAVHHVLNMVKDPDIRDDIARDSAKQRFHLRSQPGPSQKCTSATFSLPEVTDNIWVQRAEQFIVKGVGDRNQVKADVVYGSNSIAKEIEEFVEDHLRITPQTEGSVHYLGWVRVSPDGQIASTWNGAIVAK